MRQVVTYLARSNSALVYQTTFKILGTRHEFEVVRLWEQRTQPFLEAPGLLPLATLTQTADAAQTLREVAERIEMISEPRTQSNVVASTGILAGLLLKRDFINQVLRRDIMQQSVIYQEWREEFLQEGRQEGLQQEGLNMVSRQLTRRVGEISAENRSRIQALSLAQLEDLGEALLDFSSPSDLDEWLKTHGAEASPF